jgi:hypothetical protein
MNEISGPEGTYPGMKKEAGGDFHRPPQNIAK